MAELDVQTASLADVKKDTEQLWQAVTGDREARAEQTNQIISLSKDLQVLAVTVNKIADRVDAIGRPNTSLWVQIVALIFGMGVGLWGLAIRPVQNDISRISEASKYQQTNIDEIKTNRWTRQNAEDSLDHFLELSELKSEYEGKIEDLKLESVNKRLDALVGLELRKHEREPQ